MDDLLNPNDATGPVSEEAVVRRTYERDRVEDWMLVLTAVGIPFQARSDSEGFALSVPVSEAVAALRALDANDRERRAGPATAPAAPERGTGALGIVFGMLLLGFQFLTGVWETSPGSRWFAAGVADAERIRAGEWWRVLTAITLHADLMHLFGNVVASVIFVGAAARWLGPGVAALLIVLAGSGANCLTALVQRKDHLSVGASTATFAALGLLAGLQAVRSWRGGGMIRRRAWIAGGAGFALLAMLGMGARADVYAHGFALGLGLVLGLGAGAIDRPPPAAAVIASSAMGRVLQVVALLVAAALLVGAWARALGRM